MASSSRKKAVTGAVLVIIGAFFLLDNLGLDIDLPDYIFSWPMIFVVLGIINLLSGNTKPALIFFILAVFFFLQYFNLFDIGTYWPIILIIIGLLFIFRKKDSPRSAPTSDESYFDELAIFGGTGKKYVSDNLQGGKITNIFGGSDIDLTGSTAQEGAIIEVFTMFGGCEIKVPEDWKINVSTTAIFGGFSDSRKNADAANGATVHIKGFTIFGGGEIRN